VKKKRLPLIALALLLFAAIFYFSFHRDKQIIVVGNLSAQDLAEIKTVVRAEMRHRILPDFSWSSIKSLPASTMDFFQNRIQTIIVTADSKASVWFTPQHDEGFNALNLEAYELEKGTNGWRLHGVIWRGSPNRY
jgi:hypothetical protein